MKSIREWSQDLDAKFVFPRPANEQFLSSHKALWRLLSAISKVGLSVILTLVSFLLLIYSYQSVIMGLDLYYLNGYGAFITILTAVCSLILLGMCAGDFTSTFLPFREEFQLESYGGRVWANTKHLLDKNVLKKADELLKGSGVFLAPFKHSIFSVGKPLYKIFLDITRLSEAVVIFGPPGSGKSSTFFIPLLRQFAEVGGAVALDVKGELYNYSAHQFANVYRLDIENPYNSDWFDLFGGCKRNPEKARQIASFMVGNEANKSGGADPFWNDSATAMLTLFILYLCEVKKHPTPNDILTFLATYKKRDVLGKDHNDKDIVVFPLNKAFEKCEYDFIRDVWANNYSDLNERTYSSIKSKIDTILAELLSPKINEVLRPPTEEERKRGRRRIDFNELREFFPYNPDSQLRKRSNNKTKRGTAVYVVVTPGEALTLKVFLRVFFSMAVDELRNSVNESSNAKTVPVMLGIDEAGNVPLANLPEGINTDRSKKICYVLGYQEINQPYSQYGKESANSFLASVGTTVSLPGIEDDTADKISKRIGDTTILQRQSSDAKNDGLDSERFTEVGRKLILPQDLTELKKFTQCVITIKGCNPIRTQVPEDSTQTDVRIARPVRLVDTVDPSVLQAMGLLIDDNTGVITIDPNSNNLTSNSKKDLQRYQIIEAEEESGNDRISAYQELYDDEDSEAAQYIAEMAHKQSNLNARKKGTLNAQELDYESKQSEQEKEKKEIDSAGNVKNTGRDSVEVDSEYVKNNEDYSNVFNEDKRNLDDDLIDGDI